MSDLTDRLDRCHSLLEERDLLQDEVSRLEAEVARLQKELDRLREMERTARQLAAALADIVAGDIRYFPNTPTWAEGVVRRAQAALAAAQAAGIEVDHVARS